MIRINLLPYRPARRMAMLQAIAIVWVGVALLGALLAFGVDQYMLGIIDELNQTKVKNEAVIADLDKRLGEVKDLEAKIAAVEKRLHTIAMLRKGRELSVRLMEQITRQIPEKAWLTALSTKDGKLVVSGKAESSADVAQFMNQLKTSPFIASVELTQVSQAVEKGSIKMRSFSLAAPMRKPPEDPEMAKAKNKGKPKGKGGKK